MLKNFWYAVEESRRIADRPQLVRVLGQDLVLFRTGSGELAALSNQCVHRGGSLAGGVVAGDCVRCPYHGWSFGADGRCVAIPANPPGRPVPRRAQVDSYPVQERYGWVWVYLGDLPAEARPPLPPLPEFGQPGWRAIYGEFLWRASYARVVENGLDLAHAAFVHARSFGNPDDPVIGEFEVESDAWQASAEIVMSPRRPRGIWKLLRRERSEVRARLTVHMPSITRIDLRFGKWRTIIYDSNIPVDEQTTLTRWVQLRNFFTGAWADRDARHRVMKIFLEDQATVEAQRPALVPADPSTELHVRSDALALAFRKLRAQYAAMGWAIDGRAQAAERDRRSVVIPSPARRGEPTKNWVLPEVPVLPANGEPQHTARKAG
jgi:phenylpropionate dioxygenase-like ring-hydroxylating dioxygenase large terminal subunit